MEERDINQLISAYNIENVKEIKVLSGGHINKSFLIIGDDAYVLQALNQKLFKDHQDILTDNYLTYVKACDIYRKGSGPWDYPVWLKDREGNYLHIDDKEKIWRMYRYLPSDDLDVKRPDHFEIGRGLGRMHAVFSNCPGIKDIETISHLHDLSYYFEEYLRQDPEGNRRISDLDRQIERDIVNFLKIEVPGGEVIHGDAKLGNMIIKDKKVTGFIDLDTIMTGSSYDDLADCVRSCCFTKDKIDTSAFSMLLQGYEEGRGIYFTGDDRELIYMNCQKNIFILGLRYYTDYLSGRGYFNEEYPGQTTDKAKYLFSLYLTGFKGIIQ